MMGMERYELGMEEYRWALNERDSFEIGSTGWKAAQLKLEQIIKKELGKGNRRIAFEVQDDIYNMLDNGTSLEDEEVVKSLNLLKDNGFEDLAEEVLED